MKKTIVLLCLLFATGIGTSQARSGLQRFYANHHMDENTVSMKLPKFLLALVPKDAETRAVLRCLKSIRIFQMEDLSHKRRAVVSELEEALAYDNFESLLQVTDDGSRVNIYISQDATRIRHLFIMVDSDEELVLLQARTRITYAQLNDLLSGFKPGKNKTGLAKMVTLKG